MNALVTAPNAAVPVGLRKRQAFDAAGAKGHAAGIMHVAPDGSILLLRRAGTPGVDNFVGHWALPGGGVDDGETPQQGAVRENKEEMGVDVDPARLKTFHQTMTPNGHAFHTFAAPAEKKFWPTINDEHSGAGWFKPTELPTPMHPAVESALKERLGEDDGTGLSIWATMPDEAAADQAERVAKIDARIARLTDRRQATDGKITIDGDDEDSVLLRLLTYLKENSEVGHSFDVVVDPDDAELARKFYIDGDGAFRIREIMASDSRMLIAMDRESVRKKTRDGRLEVSKTNISKANVCPYRGAEIPGWEALGLEKDRVYNLLRDPEELAKAAPTLNGVQLLIKHIPVNAEDHRPNETVGSLGTDAEFDGEYLTNSLFVNAKHAIDAIETGKQQELSAGYHYKPDMTPGNFRGTAYDGVMRDIVFNHVALVEDGRAGPDVVVGDQALKEQDMKVTRFGARSLSMTAAIFAPLIAMDQKIVFSKDLFAPLTSKNFKDSRAKLLSGVRSAVDGKLRTGIALDASMEQFAKALDTFQDDMTAGVDEEAPAEAVSQLDNAATVEPATAITSPGATYDAEPMKAFMKQCGMDDAMIGKCMDMMPKPALDSEESDEDKAKREAKEKEEQAAKDAALAAKDAEMKDMVTKPAMDAAIASAVTTATKQVRETERGIRVALADVKPWVGELPTTMAFDSAADVYRQACVMREVSGAKDMHPDALLPVLKSLPQVGAKAPVATTASLAMDAAVVSKAVKLAPGLENIQTM